MAVCQVFEKAESPEDRSYRKTLSPTVVGGILHSFGYMVPAYTLARAQALLMQGDLAGARELVAPVITEFGDFDCTGRTMLLRTMKAIETLQAALIGL
jgi:hypothetical protein